MARKVSSSVLAALYAGMTITTFSGGAVLGAPVTAAVSVIGIDHSTALGPRRKRRVSLARDGPRRVAEPAARRPFGQGGRRQERRGAGPRPRRPQARKARAPRRGAGASRGRPLPRPSPRGRPGAR